MVSVGALSLLCVIRTSSASSALVFASGATLPSCLRSCLEDILDRGDKRRRGAKREREREREREKRVSGEGKESRGRGYMDREERERERERGYVKRPFVQSSQQLATHRELSFAEDHTSACVKVKSQCNIAIQNQRIHRIRKRPKAKQVD